MNEPVVAGRKVLFSSAREPLEAVDRAIAGRDVA
jgi:hypothetical protein